MREAMARAEVGGDVWGGDPTGRRLEAMAAARLGKEAAVVVASGTMGNLVSVVAPTQAGQEVVLDLDSHIYHYEVAGGTVVGNVQMRPIKTERGFPTPPQVEEAIRPSNIHLPVTRLVCLENTHNRHGGTCCTPAAISAAPARAHAASGRVPIPGDRLAEDHANARALAQGLAKLPGLEIDLASVQTNIVIIRVNQGDRAQSVKATQALVAGCAARKVKIHATGPTAIRCVTHKDVDAEDIRRALQAFREL